MSPERWAPIPGYEGLYEVSDQGRVKSLSRLVNAPQSGGARWIRERILRSALSKRGGYPMVHLLRGDGSGQSITVHRLVLLAFVGEPEPGQECCHNNDISTDCHLSNLRWDTPSANSLDAVAHGKHPQASKTHCPQGHEYGPKPSSGGRICLPCKRERYRAMRKAAA